MQIPNPEAQMSRQTRTVMFLATAFFAVNYVLRFFSLSLLRTFDVQPIPGYVGDPDHIYFEALAWAEFAFITGALQIIGGLLLLFVLAREMAKFVYGKTNYLKGAMLFSAIAFLVITVMFWTLFSIIPAGQEGLSGTRAEGMGIGVLMGIVTMLTSGVFMMICGWVLEPRKADLGIRQVAEERGWRFFGRQ